MAGYSPRSRQESDRTEQLSLSLFTAFGMKHFRINALSMASMFVCLFVFKY